MSADYPAGTVAVATVRGVPNVRVMRGDGIFVNNWCSNRPVSGTFTTFSNSDVTDVRPLVTLDPEDREQIERLVQGVLLEARSHRIDQAILDVGLTKTLREFADPKPAEPSGLGAVVEDSEGVAWIRCFRSDVSGSVWRRSGDKVDHRAANVRYDDIAAVRVLSDGVQP